MHSYYFDNSNYILYKNTLILDKIIDYFVRFKHSQECYEVEGKLYHNKGGASSHSSKDPKRYERKTLVKDIAKAEALIAKSKDKAKADAEAKAKAESDSSNSDNTSQ